MEPFKIFKFETKYNCVLILKTGENIYPHEFGWYNLVYIYKFILSFLKTTYQSGINSHK